MAKSLIIQSVHFSGIHDQISKKTQNLIQELLNPIDYTEGDGQRKAPPVEGSSSSPFAEFDKLIINFNSEF